MGCVQQAVLEFDEEIQAPWRPRLVAGQLTAPHTRVAGCGRTRPAAAPRASASAGRRRSPPECRPPGRPARRDRAGPLLREPPGTAPGPTPDPSRGAGRHPGRPPGSG